MNRILFHIVFLAVLSGAFSARGDELDPRALRAAELYSEYLDSLESFEGEYIQYTLISEKFRKTAPPGRIGVRPIVKLDGVDHELIIKGRFWFSKGLALERYETVGQSFDDSFKNIEEDRRLAAFNGQEIFAYHPIENSGSIYKPGQVPTNALIIASTVGRLLGKRVNPNPPEDLIDYIRRAKSLRVIEDLDDEIRIAGVTDAIDDGHATEVMFEAVFVKSRNYMPRYWHTGSAKFGIVQFSSEIVETFELDGVWIPKRGKSMNYYYVMKGPTEKDGLRSEFRSGGQVTIDPSTVKVNHPLSPELFTPKIPAGGRVANLITGEIINAEGVVLSVDEPVPMPALINKDSLSPRSRILFALAFSLILSGIAALAWKKAVAKR
jgi:hypothetical protein